jgi:hypothetical protein
MYEIIVYENISYEVYMNNTISYMQHTKYEKDVYEIYIGPYTVQYPAASIRIFSNTKHPSVRRSAGTFDVARRIVRLAAVYALHVSRSS